MALKSSGPNGFRQFGIFALLLILSLAVLFRQSFEPDKLLFANDNPLGILNENCLKISTGFFGVWMDLNWLGANMGAFAISLTTLCWWVLGPVAYAKFFVPIAIAFLGGSAWLCFRQFRLSPMACILGGLAVSLSSTFFSTACWGVPSQVVAFGMDFLAIAAALSRNQRAGWLALPLAGLAVGMNVTEAADIGALFSILVAGFVFYQSLVEDDRPLAWKTARGVGRTVLMAVFAGFIAAHTLSALIGTQIKGVAGTQQDTKTKADRWEWATQWSLPKRETFALFIPGVFGYRMSSPEEETQYWGAVGSDAAWDRYFDSGKQGAPPDPRAHFLRFTGGGNYLGVLVVVVSVWAAFQSLRKKDSAFTDAERRLLWFWVGAAAVSLLLAYGRFAPFYQLLYALPYFSTIRNPTKFLHIVTFAVAVVFAFGIHGLHRRFLEAPAAGARKSWWSRAATFDKRWVFGSVAALALSVAGWVVYSSSRSSVEQYLRDVLFDETTAHEIAGFSIRQVGWFILFFAASIAVLVMVFSGVFAGARSRWAGIFLGLILVVDLARANLPWIIYWNYKVKYETYGPNPIIKFLDEKPYEHRVSQLPFRPPEQLMRFKNLYDIEWIQHLFPYYNVQSLDIIQMPRVPQDMDAFERTMMFQGSPDTVHLVTRRWELTNTRYLLGPAGFLPVLNGQVDAAQQRFRIVAAFNVGPKPGIDQPTQLSELTAIPAADGAYALFEFTGALPRAKLYSNWQTIDPKAAAEFDTNKLSAEELHVLGETGTNDFLTLKQLASPSFDPSRTVLLAAAPAGATPGTNEAGTVEFVSYAPKQIKLSAHNDAPAVLMLNDKYDPDWQVWVDGRRAELLRCNYLMRGVYLGQTGAHTIEFVFKPRVNTFYVSAAAVALGFLLLGYLAVLTKREEKVK